MSRPTSQSQVAFHFKLIFNKHTDWHTHTDASQFTSNTRKRRGPDSHSHCSHIARYSTVQAAAQVTTSVSNNPHKGACGEVDASQLSSKATLRTHIGMVWACRHKHIPVSFLFQGHKGKREPPKAHAYHSNTPQKQ